MAIGSGSIANVVNTVSFGSVGNERVLTNVADGVIAAGGTQAVNGGQLFITNQNVATAQAAANAAQTTANTALTTANTAQATADTALANSAAAQSTGAAALTTANTALSAAAGAQASANAALTGVTTAQTTANTALANAAAAQTTANTAVTNAGTAQTTANTALANAATAQATGVAAQTTANTALSNAATAQATGAAAQTTANAALTLGQNAVQYDNAAHSSVTINPGGAAASVHNVAAGAAPTDAANVAQVTQSAVNALAQANSYTDTRTAATLTQANAYTDTRFNALSGDLNIVSKRADAGTAAAMAAAGLATPSGPGKSIVTVGFGTWRGQSAVAFGAAHRMDDGHWSVRVGGSFSHAGSGGNASVGYEF